MNTEQQFNQTVMSANWLNSGDNVVLAVSTGVDSMTLLTLMQQLAAKRGFRLIVAHVNHELRSQSQLEQDFLQNYCAHNQLQFETQNWPVAEHPKTGIEAAARAFRYTFFEAVMQQYDSRVLMTAHHADDQAETILMKLIRGGQLSQLRGILPEQPFATGKLVRPLLHFAKNDLVTYATKHSITWYEDETNQSDDILRNRLRHHVVPALKAENNEVLSHMQQYADQLSDVLELAADRTAELVKQLQLADNQYSVAEWQNLSVVEQRAVLTAVIQAAGIPVVNAYFEEISQLLNNPLKPTGYVTLTDKFQFAKSYDAFSINQALKVSENANVGNQIVVISNQWATLLNGLSVRLSQFSGDQMPNKWHMSLFLTENELPLKIRRAQPDDEIRLNSGGHKTVRRILIDQKVKPSLRSQQQVVVTAQGEVLWLIGIQRSSRELSQRQPNYELVIKHTD